jgi:hypothetical protein
MLALAAMPRTPRLNGFSRTAAAMDRNIRPSGRGLEATDRAATYLIVDDIHPARGTAYGELGETIKLLGAWWHRLETV